MNADLTNKLAKLIPLLATEHDGEVVATARAIQRTLRAHGMDFNDLAVELSTTTHGFDGTPYPSPFWRDYKPPEKKPPARGLYAKDGTLRLWDQVVGEILERHETIPKRYGGKFLTKEQVSRLERIFRREIAAHDYEPMIKRIDDRLQTAWEAREAEQRRRAA